MPDASLDPEATAASVLVVDDSRLSATKLAMAMRALGHRTEIAADGAEALNRLRERQFDVVLLDIVMPGMDGYAVLRALKSDEALREIPVIVVSSLDDEIGSVVKAIELGAEDFLPKNFEPEILKARLDASLSRKRFRDRELAYFRDVDRLTNAAEVIEAGAFRPAQLEIDDVAARRDPLGRLAIVFRGLAQEIYDRERRLDLMVRSLRGTLLVLAAGLFFGITPALSRMAVGLGAPPLGLVVWVNVVAAVVCLSIAAARGGLPRLTRAHLGFFVLWAIVAGLFHRSATFVVADHVEASMISLIGSLRGFIVFAVAAAIALERPSLRRLTGLGVGLAAVASLLLTRNVGNSGGVWLFAALVLPLLLAAQTLLLARRPKEIDTFAGIGLMMAVSAILLLPVAAASGDLTMPGVSLGKLGLIITILGVAYAVSLALVLDLVATAGPVFASQTAYSHAIAGVVWGMLLLGEMLSPAAWVAFALMLIGLWLVEPKRAGEEFAVTLSLSRTRPPL